MKYLLDTHTLIWFSEANPYLSERAKNIILGEDSECFVSNATFWELAIKISLGKLKLDIDLAYLENWVTEHEMTVLPTKFNHIVQLSRLEFHHRDPFDRTLIAQSLVENFIIITKETIFADYGVQTIW